MIDCAACHTLNPDGAAACLVCGATLAAVRPGPTIQARCAAGHPIDPAWRTCPYCDRLQDAAAQPSLAPTRLDTAPGAARGGTRLDGAGGEPAASPSRPTRFEESPAAGLRAGSAAAPPAAAGRPTRLEMPAAAAAPRQTVLAEAPVFAAPAATGATAAVSPMAARRPGEAGAALAAPVAAGETRKLVAVLAAPDLHPGGAVFAVRAGKNTLGASRANDICLAQDSQVSGEHAILLYRGGSFMLADRMSSNGTWVNDREVPANGAVEVRDRDRIRCGGVELLLLALETPPAAPAGAESPS